MADADKIRYEQWVEGRDLLAKGSSKIGRIGGRLKSAVGIKDAADPADPNDVFVRMDIAQGEPGYEKTVHCDRPNRLTSMLIYFCNKDDIGMEGGDFRVHKHKTEKPIEESRPRRCRGRFYSVRG